MSCTYYACWFRLDGNDSYLIWHSNDRDGVILDADGTIPAFRHVSALRSWAQEQDLPIQQEKPILHNLDVVQNWLKNPAPDDLDCVEFLNAWNLFIDVQATLEDRDVLAEGLDDGDLYDKLFWGNNLPSMTPPGEHYIPVWDEEELARLQKVLHDGLRRFQACIRYIEDEGDL